MRWDTLPQSNIFTPENGWLEYILVSFWGPAYSQVRTVSFSEGRDTNSEGTTSYTGRLRQDFDHLLSGKSRVYAMCDSAF